MIVYVGTGGAPIALGWGELRLVVQAVVPAAHVAGRRSVHDCRGKSKCKECNGGGEGDGGVGLCHFLKRGGAVICVCVFAWQEEEEEEEEEENEAKGSVCLSQYG